MEDVNRMMRVKKYATRQAMGLAAALAVASQIGRLLQQQEEVNIIFAAAPSQNEFLAALLLQDIDWTRINVFHMDEYIGLPADAPQGFGHFLQYRLFGRVPLRTVHYMNGNVPDPEGECARYTRLLHEHPTDIVCLGIGENGHLAFNDPPVADFEDMKTVKIVTLDGVCRQQQVNDGCFSALADVPARALTVTIPALMKGRFLYCTVPAASKAAAVYNTFYKKISPEYPSTILRTHPGVFMFLDEASARLLDERLFEPG
ncbi:glucosamine-6-phosphate deaminase [Niabella sp. CC-SYL272]|uniref:glucosamine-6-phosphate deaminase n=1 Tax=Niabella agricola TaxID=2891571 RepID=UPI001F2C34A3|nr:glucosamine-6-phosphate deaminase [Niabella agricola]MCF3109986.1 glucosamine-6-phosphate deaminase [Niabella agricola]